MPAAAATAMAPRRAEMPGFEALSAGRNRFATSLREIT
jgi:hypothetical protein